MQSAILGIVHLHDVRKLTQKNIAYEVRGGGGSNEVSLVEFNSLIMWKGREYFITKCSCPYFKSTFMLCPCACAACQRQQVNVYNCSHYHPGLWIGYHPLYSTALANLEIADFDNAPWVLVNNTSPVGLHQDTKTSPEQSLNDIILRNRTLIFNDLPNMGNSQRLKG